MVDFVPLGPALQASAPSIKKKIEHAASQFLRAPVYNSSRIKSGLSTRNHGKVKEARVRMVLYGRLKINGSAVTGGRYTNPCVSLDVDTTRKSGPGRSRHPVLLIKVANW